MNLVKKVMEHEVITSKKVKVVTMTTEYFNKISKEINHKSKSNEGYSHPIEGIPYEINDNQSEDFIIY
jgi:hypothetical protein